MIALVALVVVFILAIGLLTLGGNVRLSGKRQMRRQGAQILADAGIEYAYWKVKFTNAPVPATFSDTFRSGTVTVTATDNGNSLAGSMKLVSVGTESGESRTVTRVLPGKTVFGYALCSNTNLNTGTSVIATITTGSGGAAGDIRSNGSISMGQATINGGATAVGTIGGFQSITGASTPSAPAVPFPAVDLNYYAGIANRTFSTNQTWSGFTFQSPYEVVYVNGDITLSAGTISGTGTLVATGKIHFNGSLTYQFSTDKLAGIAANGMDVNSTGISVVGFYYTHNSGNNAKAIINRQFSVTQGVIAADAMDFGGGNGEYPHTFVRDSAMNPILGKQLHLPGY